MNIQIYPKSVFRKLLYVIIFLLNANIIGLAAMHHYYNTLYYKKSPLFSLFNFDSEMNIPTFYSSLALLLASMLLVVIVLNHKKQGTPYFRWLGLAIIFLFLSIDETSCIHEGFSKPVS